MNHLRRASRVAAFLPIALILAACGGATGSPPAGSTGTGGTSGATGTPAAVVSPPTTGGEATPTPPVFALPSFDIGQLAAGLENVDSYRVSISLDGAVQYSGVVVTKPVLSRDITIQGGTRIVVIGQEAWLSQSGGAFTPAPKELASSMFAAFDPTLLVGMFSGPQWAQSSQEVGTEDKNGVSAKHYRIDSTTVVGGFAGVPAGGAIDLWIADEGYLVAWESTGFAGGQISIQVTGVDDPANKVEKPV